MSMRPLCFFPFVLFLVAFVSCSVTTNGGENKFIDGPGDKFFECKPSTVIVSASNPAVSDCIIDTGLSASLVLIQYSLSGTNIPCDTSVWRCRVGLLPQSAQDICLYQKLNADLRLCWLIDTLELLPRESGRNLKMKLVKEIKNGKSYEDAVKEGKLELFQLLKKEAEN